MKTDTPRYRVSTNRGHIADLQDLNVILSVLPPDYMLEEDVTFSWYWFGTEDQYWVKIEDRQTGQSSMYWHVQPKMPGARMDERGTDESIIQPDPTIELASHVYGLCPLRAGEVIGSEEDSFTRLQQAIDAIPKGHFQKFEWQLMDLAALEKEGALEQKEFKYTEGYQIETIYSLHPKSEVLESIYTGFYHR